MAKITAAQAVKAFAKRGVTVRVPKFDEQGKPKRVLDADGKDAGSFDVEDLPLAVEHIVNAYGEGKSVTIVTVDGQKLNSDDAVEEASS